MYAAFKSRLGRRIGWGIGAVALVATSFFARPASVQAIALISSIDSDLPSDLIANPNDYWSFGDQGNDELAITWKMTNQFKNVFSSPLLQQQVRLAVKEWETASDSTQRRNPAAPYAWNRYNGAREFNDIRSVVIHEVGHAIGSQHTDASWFNNNRQLNFRPNGGGLIAAAPLGGEVMNEGNGPGPNNTPGLPTNKPAKGLRSGEYWRLVSKDELAMLDYAYGREITFQEVASNANAMLTIDVRNVGGPPTGALGIGGPDSGVRRVQNDLSQGREILSATVKLFDNADIGMEARMSSWEYTNQTGKNVKLLNIQAEGTDNRNPLQTSMLAARRFQTHEASFVIPANEFEDSIQLFKDPVGGFVPSGDTVQVGMRLDVWDWFVENAFVQTTDDMTFQANLVTIMPWQNTIVQPSGGDDDGGGILAPGLLSQTNLDMLASGLFVANSNTPTTLAQLAIAPVDGFGFDLDDLNSETRRQLEAMGLLQVFDFAAAPISLGAGDDFVFVLEGGVDDLPADLVASGNFRILSDLVSPGLAQSELFAYALSQGDDHTVGAYSLINDGPILGRLIPEPSSLAFGTLGLMSLAFVGWRQRRRGFARKT